MGFVSQPSLMASPCGRPSAMGTILLADASADQRHMYAEYLRFKGYELIECLSGVEAVTRAPEADVVVTAVRVTGPIDGIDVVRRLRVGANTARKPIIVIAGWHGDERRAHAAGCDRFLLTPCLPDALASELQRVLASRLSRPCDSLAV